MCTGILKRVTVSRNKDVPSRRMLHFVYTARLGLGSQEQVTGHPHTSSRLQYPEVRALIVR